MQPQPSSEPNIRKATAQDIDAIAQMEQRCFAGPMAYSKSHLRYLVLKAHSTCLVETQAGNLRGFIIVTYRRGSRVGSIETIDVDPEQQKMGIGAKLLAAAEEDMKKRGMAVSQLEVSVGNRAALKLYEKAGYVFKEELVGFYRFEHNGSFDAVRMVKT